MKHADRDWFYSYRELFEICDEVKLKAVANQVLQQYSKLTRNWSSNANSEWSCRTYLATKMILNATVLINSLEFAKEKGMRIANPYLEYYAVLSLLRCVVYTLPDQSWADGKLMSISHTKAINLTFDWLAKFDGALAEKLKKTTLQLKAQREVISYKAPASGDSILGNQYDLEYLLIVLAEVAQFNSELLEWSITKNAKESTFVVHSATIEQIYSFKLEGYSFHDKEDSYRLSYIQRKIQRPYNINFFMT